MTRASWDSTWMKVAAGVAERSWCDSRQVGAVIVTAENRLVSSGYNGPPAGLPITGHCTNWCPRRITSQTADYSNCLSVHGEANALLFADRSMYEGGTIYVTSAICWECAKMVANSGLARVVMNVWKADAHRQPGRSIDLLEDSGLKVTVLYPEA